MRIATPAGGTYKGWSLSSLTAAAGSAVRGALGAFVLPGATSFPRPPTTLTLYSFEACPFCQKVREAMSLLDLPYLHKPCPKGGKVWRPEAAGLIERVRGPATRFQVPLLVDGGEPILESDAIIKHLFDKYGPGAAKIPATLRIGGLAALGCGLSRAVRPGKGVNALPTKATTATKPLNIWGYEPSPFVRLVRERADELEIPYVMESAARGSAQREAMAARLADLTGGHAPPLQFPYLEDPNTDLAMFESGPIVDYLQETYGA